MARLEFVVQVDSWPYAYSGLVIFALCSDIEEADQTHKVDFVAPEVSKKNVLLSRMQGFAPIRTELRVLFSFQFGSWILNEVANRMQNWNSKEFT